MAGPLVKSLFNLQITSVGALKLCLTHAWGQFLNNKETPPAPTCPNCPLRYSRERLILEALCALRHFYFSPKTEENIRAGVGGGQQKAVLQEVVGLLKKLRE